jgi:PAS domain-containing protein
MVLTTKSGEQRIWEYRNTLQSVRDKTWVQGNARDVTAQVEAKRALRASTAKLQALVDSIDEMAFEFDVDGTFLDRPQNFRGVRSKSYYRSSSRFSSRIGVWSG